MPANAPALLRVSPGGSVPPATVVQVMGAVPLAVKLKLYTDPAIPAGGAALVMAGATGVLTVMVTFWVASGSVPFAAVTVKEYAAPTVGVPLSSPPEARVIPGGNDPVAV